MTRKELQDLQDRAWSVKWKAEDHCEEQTQELAAVLVELITGLMKEKNDEE